MLQTTGDETESMCLADLARYGCSVGDRFGEIYEPLLESSPIPWRETETVGSKSIRFTNHVMRNPLLCLIVHCIASPDDRDLSSV